MPLKYPDHTAGIMGQKQLPQYQRIEEQTRKETSPFNGKFPLCNRVLLFRPRAEQKVIPHFSSFALPRKKLTPSGLFFYSCYCGAKAAKF